MTTARKTRRPAAIAPPTRETARALRKMGVRTWVHDRVYAVVADHSAPHGFRFVASAPSFDSLVVKLALQMFVSGKL